MSAIKVNETDLSWYYRQRDPGQLTVLVPGVSSFGPVDRPVLVNDSNFYKTLGGRVSACPDDISFDMAESFVKSGISVLFWRINFKSDDPIDTARATSGPLEIVRVVPVEGYYKEGKFYEDKTYTIQVTLEEGKSYKDKDSGNLYYVVKVSEEPVQLVLRKFNTSNVISLPFFSKLSNLVVQAKYPGTFGNKLSVKFIGSGDTVRYFVYREKSKVVEDGLVNFVDPLSESYYETVNVNSSYIDFKVTTISDETEVEEGSVPTVQGSGEGLIVLENGLDYISTEDGSSSSSTPSAQDLGLQSGPSGQSEQESSAKIPYDIFVSNLKSGNNKTFTELQDPLLYQFNIAVNGGFTDVSSSSQSSIGTIDKSFVSLCATKGNAIYLVDGIKEMTSDEFYTYCGLPKETTSDDSGSFNTSYAAAFGPWGSYKLVSNGVVRQLPGSYPFLVRWGQSLSSGSPVWMAPAGVKRAQLNSLVRSTNYQIGSAILEQWQGGDDLEDVSGSDSSYKVNPIVDLKQYGYVIYGNSTLLRNGVDGSTSMLQSFSTRVLANLIKDRAFDISLTLQFDQVDDDLFAQFKTLMTVFMDQLKYGGALYDYAIIVDRSELTLDQLNSRTVPVRILISPNPAVENFIINLEISQAGVTFNDDTDASSEASSENV